MKKKNLVIIGGLLVALIVVGVIGATNALAQSSTLGIPWHGGGHGDGHGFRLGGPELEAAAKVLDMTTDELSAALQGGKTLDQLASEAGVDLQDVEGAIQAAHETELRDRIKQAVADGSMSQEKADWLLEGLDKGFLDGPGFGFGFGPHGPRPDQAPAIRPTQSGSG
jgi:hypothetical protein